METDLSFRIHKVIYAGHNIFMVSFWGRYSYFNNKKIKTRDVVLMNSEYRSSVSFGSRVGSKSIEHNTYIGRRSNFCSKPIPIRGPVNKSEFKFSYLRIHFSWLP